MKWNFHCGYHDIFRILYTYFLSSVAWQIWCVKFIYVIIPFYACVINYGCKKRPSLSSSLHPNLAYVTKLAHLPSNPHVSNHRLCNVHGICTTSEGCVLKSLSLHHKFKTLVYVIISMRVGEKANLLCSYFGFFMFSSKKKISNLIFLQFHYFTQYPPAPAPQLRHSLDGGKNLRKEDASCVREWQCETILLTGSETKK